MVSGSGAADKVSNMGQQDGLSQLTELMRYEPVREAPSFSEPVDPARRRKRRRRRTAIGLIVALVIAGTAGGYSAYALTAPLGAATLDAQTPHVDAPPPAQIALPVDGAYAVSVSGADDYLGATASGTWASGGGDGQRPMASITKLITALVVLNAKPLADVTDPGPTITFDRDDHALYDKYYVMGATIAAMPTGSSLSLRQSLEAMLIASASNYADAVSTWAFGSRSAFVNATKEWLAANGLASTTVVEPTGIDPRNVSTPADLLALGRIAMANPVVAQIAGMRVLNVPNIPATATTNTLLGIDGVTGLKTGTLEESGSNLLFSATVDAGTGQPLTVVGVILGGFTRESVNGEVRALLGSIRDGFHTVVVGEAGQRVGTYSTAWGESADILLGEGASLLTWSDAAIDATFEATPLTTAADGDVVGSATWTAGPNTITVPLVLDGTIDPPTAWWRLTHPFELGE
jgi:D-alanyl-D-alanine carboxypeptidase (penicillin-binding protein 5/6)